MCETLRWLVQISLARRKGALLRRLNLSETQTLRREPVRAPLLNVVGVSVVLVVAPNGASRYEYLGWMLILLKRLRR